MFNPFERVPVAATVRRDITLPDEKIVAVWWGIEVSGSFAGIVRTVSLTGQRREEVAGMTWNALDDDLSIWTIPAAPADARWGNSDCAARSRASSGLWPSGFFDLILMLHFQGQMTCNRI